MSKLNLTHTVSPNSQLNNILLEVLLGCIIM